MKHRCGEIAEVGNDQANETLHDEWPSWNVSLEVVEIPR
jgi:hypothetical protein